MRASLSNYLKNYFRGQMWPAATYGLMGLKKLFVSTESSSMKKADLNSNAQILNIKNDMGNLARHNSNELCCFSNYLSKTSDYLLSIFDGQFLILKKVEEHTFQTHNLVNDVEIKILDAAASSTQAKAEADAGRLNMTNLTSSVLSLNEIRELLVGFEKVIHDLTVQMNKIDDIVFMAKLLSFNATIEAARVGDLGNGMSIVALEMTKLSGQIGKTSNEIQSTLKASNENLSSVSAKVTHLISDSTQLINSSQTSFSGIINEIYALTGKISEINSSLSDYKKSTKQLDEILNDITKTSTTLGTASANTKLVKINLEELNNYNKKYHQD